MATFIKIASITVGAGGAATIDFTSIPNTYTDLVLKLSLRTDEPALGNAASIALNGSTTGFTNKLLEGNGATAASASLARFIAVYNGATSTSNTFSSTDVYFPNYAGNTNKSISSDSVSENNGTTAYAELLANLWSNTAAINQITISAIGTQKYVQYSTATLYGISKS